MADLSTRLFGLRLKNPIMAAAGPNTADAAAVAAAIEGGAGAVVTRTAVLAPPAEQPAHAGYGRDGLFNNQYASPLPFDAWLQSEYPAALRAARAAGVPLVASIGYDPAAVARMAPLLQNLGVDAIELSTHHARREAVLPALRALKQACSLPVSVKLSAHHGDDMADFAAELEPYTDAFTVMNSFGPTLLVDADKAEPAIGSDLGIGYLSGVPVHPIAVRFVFELARRVKKPIIACGGVARGRDALEFLMVGATAVQVCSEAVLRGARVYGQIAGQMGEWLDKQGHASVAAVQGAYVRLYGGGQRVITEKQEAPRLIEELCIKCTACGIVCFYDAIEAPPRQLPTITAEPCFQCGLCATACPTDALWFTPREQVTLLTGD